MTDPTHITGYMPTINEWLALVSAYRSTQAELTRANETIVNLRVEKAQMRDDISAEVPDELAQLRTALAAERANGAALSETMNGLRSELEDAEERANVAFDKKNKTHGYIGERD